VAGDQVMAEAVVEDAQAVGMVKSGTLSQLSFGGNYIERHNRGDGTFSIVIDPLELSLVDAACVGSAVITSVSGKADGLRLYRRDGRMEVVRAKQCGCERCRKARDGEEDEITFDRSLFTREGVIEWLHSHGYEEALQADVLDEGEYWVFEKALTGVEKMNASDHSKLAALHRRLSGFHKSVHETHAEIAAHHEKMAGHGGEGIRNPRGFGEVTQDFTHAQKSFYDPTPEEAAGGLRKLT
jgi:hypothetical protein